MKNLDLLKEEHANLVSLNSTKNEMICVDFHSFANMSMGGVDIRDLSDFEARVVYQNRINTLKAKLEVLDHLVCAVRECDEKMIKALDYFNETERDENKL